METRAFQFYLLPKSRFLLSKPTYSKLWKMVGMCSLLDLPARQHLSLVIMLLIALFVGTGKSVLLRAIIRELRRAGKKVAVTATTGIAALGIKGQTLHSFAGINTGKEIAELLYRKVNRSKSTRKRWQSTETLIIDEGTIPSCVEE